MTQQTIRLEQLFEEQYLKNPNNDCLIQINANNTTTVYSYKLVGNLAAKLADYIFSNYIKTKKIKAGSLVILASSNNPNWLISELALLSLDLVTVPAYTTYTKQDFDFILADTKAKIVLSSKGSHLDQLKKSIKNSKPKIDILILDDIIPKLKSDLEEKKTTIKFKANKSRNSNKDALIIYTSGSSGNPKGVRLSHKALMANVESVKKAILATISPKLTQHRFFSFLPLSHSYEHLAGLWFPIFMGAKIYYPSSREKLLPNLLIAKPSIMTAVPRFYELVRQKILSRMKSKSKLVQNIFNYNISIFEKICYGERLSFYENLFLKTISKILIRNIAALFGPNFQVFISGGAALNNDIYIFFKSLGLSILQGYGMTECSPVISVNLPNQIKIGSVGKALDGVSVKTSKESEIMVKGDLLMTGYHNHNSEFKVDGYLMTGDIGWIDEDGFIFITDRKKDIIVLSSGDNISPQRIESFLNLEESISQSMVFGNGFSHLSAIIVSNQSADVASAIARTNQKLQNYEKIRKYFVITSEFNSNNQMLTHSSKVKRSEIVKKYHKQFQSLYNKKT